jgi:hypothetical protein
MSVIGFCDTCGCAEALWEDGLCDDCHFFQQAENDDDDENVRPVEDVPTGGLL